MSTLSIVFYAMSGIFVAGLIESLWSYRQTQLANTSKRRLSEMAARLYTTSPNSEVGTILRPGSTRGGKWLRSPLYLAPSLLLYRAGISTSAWNYAGFSLTFGVLAAWATSLTTFRLDVAIAAGCLATLAPWGRALYLKRARTRAFEAQLPAALELMCRGLRAGHGFRAGLQMVAQELGEPISPEFGMVSDEITLGLDIREALKNLTHRVDVQDLQFLTTAVLIQRETGGNLAEVVGRLADVIRERQSFFVKSRSLTSQNRGAANILAALPFVFVLLMHYSDPNFVAPLYTTPDGEKLAIGALCMTVVGYFSARQIANVRF